MKFILEATVYYKTELAKVQEKNSEQLTAATKKWETGPHGTI